MRNEKQSYDSSDTGGPGWDGLRASRVHCHMFIDLIGGSRSTMIWHRREGLSIPENRNVGRIVESTNDIEADAGENGDSKNLQHKGRWLFRITGMRVTSWEKLEYDLSGIPKGFEQNQGSGWFKGSINIVDEERKRCPIGGFRICYIS